MPQKKNQKMSLGTFLGDQSLGSWADEMEDMPMPSSDKSGYGGFERRGQSSFGADREWSRAPDRDYQYRDREQLPIPTRPPFTAHLGNLSFDVTAGDVEAFLEGCEVTNVRIVEDKIERKPKGFGYVEFATVEGLKQALTLSGSQFQGRNIRISVADPPKDRGDGREVDWTARKGPLPELPANNRRVSDRGPYRGFDAGSDAGSERGFRRNDMAGGDGRTRDMGTWERKGPLSPAASTGPGPGREGGRPRVSERSFERKQSPAWGEGRSQDGSRPPAKPFVERQPTAAEMDTQWRARMRPDPPAQSPQPTPEPSAPSSPAAPSAPAVRPKLNLQKRTVSETPASDTTTSAGGDSKASPFGGARPVDSATREQEVVEKRLALRQKKDEEDKAKEERVKAEKAAKAAEKQATEGSSPQENGRQGAQKDSKENGAAGMAGRQYELLRRVADQEDGAPEVEDGSVAGASANGDVPDPSGKDVLPKEVTRQVDSSGTVEQAEKTTAEELAEEGWETVPSGKNKNRRGGNQSARALAS